MGRTLQIPVARAYLPLLTPSRYKGAHGGRGSAKSHFFGGLLIDDHLNEPGMRSVCLREVQKSLDQSVKRLLEDKIEEFYLTKEFTITKNHIETPGDGLIIFQGLQNHTAESIKSLEGFRRAWVEEAQSLSDRSLTMLRPTIRQERCKLCLKKGQLVGTPCAKSLKGHVIEEPEIWFSWNPDNPKDAVDKFLRGPVPAPDAIVVGTTYRDNPWLPGVLRKEMEWDRLHDVNKYAHIWGGGYLKHSEARVFKNWKVEEFVSPPESHFMLGADWGFSVDPSTLFRSREEKTNPLTGQAWPRKRLYIDYELYAIGVEIDHLPRFFDGLVCGCRIQADGSPMPGECHDKPNHGWAKPWPIIADSARPETISYLRRHGYGRIEGAKKGAGSVKEGVIFLQGYDIIIHPRCIHTIDEFTMYSYVIDKNRTNDDGTPLVLPILEDKKNHIIDPIRYSVEQLRGQLRVHKAVWG